MGGAWEQHDFDFDFGERRRNLFIMLRIHTFDYGPHRESCHRAVITASCLDSH